MRTLELVRDEWHDHQYQAMLRAEDETAGNLIRRDQRRRFEQVFGITHAGILRGLFLSAAHVRKLYASPELLSWWQYNGYYTFEQYAWHSGHRNLFLRHAKRLGRIA